MSMTTANMGDITHGEVWSTQLKELLTDDLMAMNYVNWIGDFSHGDTWLIPTLGQLDVDDYEENELVVYRPMDTGQFTLQVTNYKSSAVYITKKAMQDAAYSGQMVASFVPEQHRALMENLESQILGLHSQQTSASLNPINGAPHRFVGGGTSDSIAVADFAKARYSLKKANVPDTNLIAIVDPSVEYDLNTLSNLVDVSNNPRWEGIVADGIASGMRFVKNVYGFDVYVSNRLDTVASETIDSNSITNGKANLFFSAAPNVQPFIGAWRQAPEVDEEYNKDRQRYEYLTTTRYALDLYRPENLVTVLTADNV